MVKDKDWNSAFIGSEDWTATMGSEVFRNFTQIMLAQEKQEQIEKEAAEKKELECKANSIESIDSLMNLIKDASSNDSVKNPLKRNEDYDEDYFDHIKKHTKSGKEISDELDEAEQIKKASLKEAEQLLGLQSNAFYINSLIKGNHGE